MGLIDQTIYLTFSASYHGNKQNVCNCVQILANFETLPFIIEHFM